MAPFVVMLGFATLTISFSLGNQFLFPDPGFYCMNKYNHLLDRTNGHEGIKGGLYGGKPYSDCYRDVAPPDDWLNRDPPRPNLLEICAGSSGTTEVPLTGKFNCCFRAVEKKTSGGYLYQSMCFRNETEAQQSKRLNDLYLGDDAVPTCPIPTGEQVHSHNGSIYVRFRGRFNFTVYSANCTRSVSEDDDGDTGEVDNTKYKSGNHGCRNKVRIDDQDTRPVNCESYTITECESECNIRREVADEGECGAFDFTPIANDPDNHGTCCMFESKFFRPEGPSTGNEPAGRVCHYFRQTVAQEFSAYVDEILGRLIQGTPGNGNPRPSDYNLNDDHLIAGLLKKISELHTDQPQRNKHQIVGRFSKQTRRRRDEGLLDAGCSRAPVEAAAAINEDSFLVVSQQDHGDLEIFLCECNINLPTAPENTVYVTHETCFETAAVEDNGGDGNGGGDDGGGGTSSGGGGGSSDTTSGNTGGGLGGGAIAGIVVGSLAGVGLIWFGISRSGFFQMKTSAFVAESAPFYSEESKVFI